MSRIEELERRVRQDPASITFGALAEEYRRAGRLDDAVAACRTGLERHPSYVSARVTLGRALQQMGQQAEARAEFEYVLSIASDNLAAIRGLAEMHGTEVPEAAHQLYTPPPPRPAPAPPAVTAAPPAPAPPPAAPARAVLQPSATPEPDPIINELATVDSGNDIPSAFGAGDPDLAALDASIEAAAVAADATPAGSVDGAPEAQRAAQIERLEIWLVRLDELRRDGRRRA